MMGQKSTSLSVLLGVGILALVTLGSGGLAYSFYRTEISETREKSSDVANEDGSSDSPFAELESEQNIITTPVPTGGSGSGSIESDNSGIPIGTYSNPPSTITPTSDLYAREGSNSINDFDSSIAEDDSLYEENTFDSINSVPDYSSPSSSNNFNSINNNDSLIRTSSDSDLLNTPTLDDRLSNTTSLDESPF